MRRVDVVVPWSPEVTPERLKDRAVRSIKDQEGVDARPVVVVDTRRNGPAWARNAGMDRARSRYVAFLDADDEFIAEDKLLRQIRRMREEDVGLSVAVPGRYRTVERFGIDVALERVTAFTSSVVVDTDLAGARWDEQIYRREDHLFALQAAVQAGIVTVEPGVVREGPGGLSGREEALEKYAAYREWWGKAVECAPFLRNVERRYRWHSCHRVGRSLYFEGRYRESVAMLARAVRWRPWSRSLPAWAVSAWLYAWTGR